LKAQTKKQSLIEALVNIVVGIGLSFASGVFIFWWKGIKVDLGTQGFLTLYFTAVSLIRSYALRRYFNWRTEVRLRQLTDALCQSGKHWQEVLYEKEYQKRKKARQKVQENAA
jgi:hypothetical protein